MPSWAARRSPRPLPRGPHSSSTGQPCSSVSRPRRRRRRAGCRTTGPRRPSSPSCGHGRTLPRGRRTGRAPRSGPLLDGGLRPTLHSTLVEAWLVEVWGALRSGDRPAARQALRTALDLAEPMDPLRPFALAGRGQRVLLVDQLGGARDPDLFAFRCLAARRQMPTVAPELSAREQDVLGQLISLSNLGEIADDLDVSVNTVKSHVRAIYGKLGVNTRRRAVLTALERGMLT